MALAKASGGSGYSGTLSNNAAIRKQQLTCDPDEPLGGSTSVRYDASLVRLSGVMAGPGYEQGFSAFVEVQPVGAARFLQPIGEFLEQPAGAETGYAQVRYQLRGDAGQIPIQQGFELLDERGVDGVDTHALFFDLRPGVPPDAQTVYTVFAAEPGRYGPNDPGDFLIVSDGTRLGPEQLTPTVVFAKPGDVAPPEVTIEPVSPDPRSTPVGAVTIGFSEAVTGFDLDDLLLTRGRETVPLARAQIQTEDNKVFTLQGLQELTAQPGEYTLRVLIGGADVIDAAGNPLSKGAAETWVTDQSPPAVLSNSFDFTASHQVLFTFSENVGASLGADDLELTNLTTRTTFLPGELAVSYDETKNTASFTLRSGPLPNGNYTATLLPAGVIDAAGNALSPDNTVLEFYVLNGDINRDRAVNGSDFAILAGNFGKRDQDYAAGDINGDGAVNGTDFAILAGNFGKTVPPPLASVVGSVINSATTPSVTTVPAPTATKPAKPVRPAKRPSPRGGDAAPPPSQRRRQRPGTLRPEHRRK